MEICVTGMYISIYCYCNDPSQGFCVGKSARGVKDDRVKILPSIE